MLVIIYPENHPAGKKTTGLQHLWLEIHDVPSSLVVSTCFNPPEQYEFVSWDYDIPIHSQYDGKVIIQPCSKPPTNH